MPLLDKVKKIIDSDSSPVLDTDIDITIHDGKEIFDTVKYVFDLYVKEKTQFFGNKKSEQLRDSLLNLVGALAREAKARSSSKHLILWMEFLIAQGEKLFAKSDFQPLASLSNLHDIFENCYKFFTQYQIQPNNLKIKWDAINTRMNEAYSPHQDPTATRQFKQFEGADNQKEQEFYQNYILARCDVVGAQLILAEWYKKYGNQNLAKKWLDTARAHHDVHKIKIPEKFFDLAQEISFLDSKNTNPKWNDFLEYIKLHAEKGCLFSWLQYYFFTNYRSAQRTFVSDPSTKNLLTCKYQPMMAYWGYLFFYPGLEKTHPELTQLGVAVYEKMVKTHYGVNRGEKFIYAVYRAEKNSSEKLELKELKQLHSWLYEAAEGEHAVAQYYIGIFQHLLLAERDRAARWFRKSAQQNYPLAEIVCTGLDKQLSAPKTPISFPLTYSLTEIYSAIINSKDIEIFKTWLKDLLGFEFKQEKDIDNLIEHFENDTLINQYLMQANDPNELKQCIIYLHEKYLQNSDNQNKTQLNKVKKILKKFVTQLKELSVQTLEEMIEDFHASIEILLSAQQSLIQCGKRLNLYINIYKSLGILKLNNKHEKLASIYHNEYKKCQLKKNRIAPSVIESKNVDFTSPSVTQSSAVIVDNLSGADHKSGNASVLPNENPTQKLPEDVGGITESGNTLLPSDSVVKSPAIIIINLSESDKKPENSAELPEKIIEKLITETISVLPETTKPEQTQSRNTRKKIRKEENRRKRRLKKQSKLKLNASSATTSSQIQLSNAQQTPLEQSITTNIANSEKNLPVSSEENITSSLDSTLPIIAKGNELLNVVLPVSTKTDEAIKEESASTTSGTNQEPNSETETQKSKNSTNQASLDLPVSDTQSTPNTEKALSALSVSDTMSMDTKSTNNIAPATEPVSDTMSAALSVSVLSVSDTMFREMSVSDTNSLPVSDAKATPNNEDGSVAATISIKKETVIAPLTLEDKAETQTLTFTTSQEESNLPNKTLDIREKVLNFITTHINSYARYPYSLLNQVHKNKRGIFNMDASVYGQLEKLAQTNVTKLWTHLSGLQAIQLFFPTVYPLIKASESHLHAKKSQWLKNQIKLIDSKPDKERYKLLVRILLAIIIQNRFRRGPINSFPPNFRLNNIPELQLLPAKQRKLNLLLPYVTSLAEHLYPKGEADHDQKQSSHSEKKSILAPADAPSVQPHENVNQGEPEPENIQTHSVISSSPKDSKEPVNHKNENSQNDDSAKNDAPNSDKVLDPIDKENTVETAPPASLTTREMTQHLKVNGDNFRPVAVEELFQNYPEALAMLRDSSNPSGTTISLIPPAIQKVIALPVTEPARITQAEQPSSTPALQNQVSDVKNSDVKYSGVKKPLDQKWIQFLHHRFMQNSSLKELVEQGNIFYLTGGTAKKLAMDIEPDSLDDLDIVTNANHSKFSLLVPSKTQAHTFYAPLNGLYPTDISCTSEITENLSVYANRRDTAGSVFYIKLNDILTKNAAELKNVIIDIEDPTGEAFVNLDKVIYLGSKDEIARKLRKDPSKLFRSIWESIRDNKPLACAQDIIDSAKYADPEEYRKYLTPRVSPDQLDNIVQNYITRLRTIFDKVFRKRKAHVEKFITLWRETNLFQTLFPEINSHAKHLIDECLNATQKCDYPKLSIILGKFVYAAIFSAFQINKHLPDYEKKLPDIHTILEKYNRYFHCDVKDMNKIAADVRQYVEKLKSSQSKSTENNAASHISPSHSVPSIQWNREQKRDHHKPTENNLPQRPINISQNFTVPPRTNEPGMMHQPPSQHAPQNPPFMFGAEQATLANTGPFISEAPTPFFPNQTQISPEQYHFLSRSIPRQPNMMTQSQPHPQLQQRTSSFMFRQQQTHTASNVPIISPSMQRFNPYLQGQTGPFPFSTQYQHITGQPDPILAPQNFQQAMPSSQPNRTAPTQYPHASSHIPNNPSYSPNVSVQPVSMFNRESRPSTSQLPQFYFQNSFNNSGQ